MRFELMYESFFKILKGVPLTLEVVFISTLLGFGLAIIVALYSEIKNLFNTPEFLDYSLPNGKIIQRSIVRETSDGYTNVSTFYQPDLEVALRKKVSESDRMRKES